MPNHAELLILICFTRRAADKDFSIHKLILGTYAGGSEQNHLMIADVLLPLPELEIDARRYDDERGGECNCTSDFW